MEQKYEQYKKKIKEEQNFEITFESFLNNGDLNALKINNKENTIKLIEKDLPRTFPSLSMKKIINIQINIFFNLKKYSMKEVLFC